MVISNTQRSPLGAFYRTPLGVRGSAEQWVLIYDGANGGGPDGYSPFASATFGGELFIGEASASFYTAGGAIKRWNGSLSSPSWSVEDATDFGYKTSFAEFGGKLFCGGTYGVLRRDSEANWSVAIYPGSTFDVIALGGDIYALYQVGSYVYARSSATGNDGLANWPLHSQSPALPSSTVNIASDVAVFGGSIVLSHSYHLKLYQVQAPTWTELSPTIYPRLLTSFGGYLYGENRSSRGELWRTSDLTNWSLVQDFIVDIYDIFTDGTELYVSVNGGMHRSTDGTSFDSLGILKLGATDLRHLASLNDRLYGFSADDGYALYPSW